MKALTVAGLDGRAHPRLGKRADGDVWHPKIKLWWAEVWGSPVCTNLDRSDYLDVWILADMKHLQLTATSNAEKVRMGTEARQMANTLGLNPKARQTQKVEIDRGEQAEGRTRKRRNKAVVRDADDKTDPRDALTA